MATSMVLLSLLYILILRFPSKYIHSLFSFIIPFKEQYNFIHFQRQYKLQFKVFKHRIKEIQVESTNFD